MHNAAQEAGEQEALKAGGRRQQAAGGRGRRSHVWQEATTALAPFRARCTGTRAQAVAALKSKRLATTLNVGDNYVLDIRKWSTRCVWVIAT